MITHSAEETIKLGIHLGREAAVGTVFCLFGDLGAGKTTLIKGIVEGATGIREALVMSPTFLYLNHYLGESKNVYHFDLYRLKNAEEFLSMGFEEYFFADGIACVEWSERIASILPKGHIKIALSDIGEGRRNIVIE